jgi:hypothetical protein
MISVWKNAIKWHCFTFSSVPKLLVCILRRLLGLGHELYGGVHDPVLLSVALLPINERV